MFKKLKDKIAEEVKSSPQRLQQFAQAAQAAVTSASSSASDISNNDFFTIADEGSETPRRPPALTDRVPAVGFRDVPLGRSPTPPRVEADNGMQETMESPAPPTKILRVPSVVGDDHSPMADIRPSPGSGTRRRSDVSTASDVSFRLPSYESSGQMFHLQSDLDVSASEIEDNVSIPAQLERVSKEHLYAAYKKTNDKYNKYRGRYTDLARHYRNLERENTKAKAVLVETQDKALRRISELREQCQLEQSAKAHLENALRLELDERNLKIESLDTKIKLLQSYSLHQDSTETPGAVQSKDINLDKPLSKTDDIQSEQNQLLIDLSTNHNATQSTDFRNFIEVENEHSVEIQNLNNKIQKLEQLLVKYKETIKSHKEKNIQLNTEIQILSGQLEKNDKEKESLQVKVKEIVEITSQLTEANEKIVNLQEDKSRIEHKNSSEISKLESELQAAKKEIVLLNDKIDLYNKREEENVISLAENKLSIHQELESKENEIKSLNKSLLKSESDLSANETIINDMKHKIKTMEDESNTMKERLNALDEMKKKTIQLENKIVELKSQNQDADVKYVSLMENLKCTELQLKQESDEKLAIIDRNNFLESRNKQLTEENSNKTKQTVDLEKKLTNITLDRTEMDTFKSKYEALSIENSSLKTEFEEITNTNKKIADESKALTEKCSNLFKTVEKFKLANSDLVKLKQKLNRDIRKLEDNNTHLQESNKTFSIKINSLMQTFQIESDKFTDRISLLETELASNSLNTQEKAIEAIRIELNEQLKTSEVEYERQINQKSTEYEELKQEFSNIKIKNNELIAECQSSASKLESLQIEMETSNSKMQTIQSEYEILKSECEQFSNTNNNLQGKLSAFERENVDLKSQITKLIEEVDNSQRELVSLEKSHVEMVQEKSNIEKKISAIEKWKSDAEREIDSNANPKVIEIEKLKESIRHLESEKEALSKRNIELSENSSRLQKNASSVESELKEYKENNEVWELKLSNILDDNNALQEKCRKLKQERETSSERIASLERKIDELESSKAQLEEAKLEKEFLNMRIRQLESDQKQVMSDKNDLILKYDNLQREILNLTSEKNNKIDQMTKEIDTVKLSEIKHNSDREALTKEKSNIESRLNEELVEKEKLILKLKAFEDESGKYDTLMQEKIVIERQLSEYTKKYESAEDEQRIKIENISIENNKLKDSLASKNDEGNELSKLYTALKTEHDSLNAKVKALEQAESEHTSTAKAIQSSNDENRKLTSDVEDLQTRLAELTKENSRLEDKIRDMFEIMQSTQHNNFASDPIRSNETVSLELVELKEENLALKEKIRDIEIVNGNYLDLERQNSILIEEKLELEDQIKSSMKRNDHLERLDDEEVNSKLRKMHLRIEDLTGERSELESRLADLELANRSNDDNMRVLEQKNEKLGLTNEKLERRLDEALVSLSHIRTLEENTELEYLRNILYEYLTGPVNNNMVLAKVLSAVVKFDRRQTQLVLEREKERQGLLGQLGLL